MKILGIHMTGSQSSAALYANGEIVCGVAEERLNRIKQSRQFPTQAIRFCLNHAAIRYADVDAIAVSWNPVRNLEAINMSGFTSWRRYDPEWLYIVPNQLATAFGLSFDKGASLFQWDCVHPQGAIHYVDHHHAHLASAAFASPFERCACLISDEYAETKSLTLAKVEGTDITVLGESEFPHSLGSYYAMVTEFLGFQPNSDEWKVMGAAAYGDKGRFHEKLARLVHWDDSVGKLELDLRYFNHFNMKVGTYISPRFEEYLGIRRRQPGEELGQVHYDLAAAMQATFEETMLRVLDSLRKLTRCTDLAVAGGSFMNSLFNGRLTDGTGFSRAFVPFAPADNGGAVGSALWVAHRQFNEPRRNREQEPSPFLGPGYSEQEIEDTLTRYHIPFEKCTDPAQRAARAVADGQIVGWFQGRMEFGERALGNRSILADPRDAGMKDKVNRSVKYREAFRPFAPSVLAHRADEYFEMKGVSAVPYMERVLPVRAEKRHQIPAVTHRDGTGRLQTVDKQANPLFHALISCFESITAVPVVLNTSFNLQGEPIVCSPTDAIRTFFSSGLDVLVMGSCVVSKTHSG